MDMASNFVKELRDLVKKKPKNGTVASPSSPDEDEETDSPLTPRKFEQSFLDGKCKTSHEKFQVRNSVGEHEACMIASEVCRCVNYSPGLWPTVLRCGCTLFR